jgi:hypothetical protein
MVTPYQSIKIAESNLRRTKPPSQRFWSYVNKGDEEKCWLWKGDCDSKGYGRIGFGGHSGPKISAHRLSWTIHNGVIPEELCVLHKCDTPLCVNPNHLFLGTQADNCADMARKGRQPNPRLKEKQVLEIRELYKQGGITQEKLSKRYGVCPANISFIVNNIKWKHIRGEGQNGL